MATYKEQLEQNNAKIEEIKKALENKVVGKGQLDITENGVHDVVGYETANVNVVNKDFSSLVNGTITRFDDVNGDITYVKPYTFASCYDLSYVNLPNASIIKEGAFYHCSSLKYVNLPNALSIGYMALSYCSRLSEINIENVEILASSVFYYCINLSSININKYVEAVGSRCFLSCSGLKNFSAPYLNSLYDTVFSNCYNLESVNIEFTSGSITGSVFSNCYKLKNLNLYNVTGIYGNAFTNCSSLSSLYLYTNSVISLNGSFSSNPFVDSSYLGYYGSIYVPENRIESYKIAKNWSAYADRFVAIPYSELSQVAAYQFRESQILEIPSQFLNTSAVGMYGFYNNSFETVYLPECEVLYSYVFGGCFNLTEISLPKLKRLGMYAFANCSNLKSFDCKNLTSIAPYAFLSCRSLSSIYNIDSISQISGYAFAGCTRLSSAEFKNCIIVSSSAFSYCTSLSVASFPKCTTIHIGCFDNCYKLLSLYLSGHSVCLLSSSVFKNTPIGGYTNLTSGVYGSVYVPESLVSEYKVATNWVSVADRIVGYNPEQ